MPHKGKSLDLSKGSIIHIEDFKGLVLESKDKYVYVIGHQDPATILAFVVSSQIKYTSHPRLSREQVTIPKGTLSTLPKESWIQCFYDVHRLSIAELQAGFLNYEIKHKGRLGQEFLVRVRDVIRCSDVLNSYDIQDCLNAIDSDRSKP